ncbi:MAG: DUF6526 family protein [Bacteroidia bacterium]
MATQNYHNHIRWYVPHHFIFYPVMLALMVFCGYKAVNVSEAEQTLWIVLGIGFFTISWLAYMLRQHYALTLQNRLVLTELRYRYFVLTGNRFEPFEAQLSDGQLFALRFAPDEEFADLTKRAVSEKLSPDAIKKSIKNWNADYRRV